MKFEDLIAKCPKCGSTDKTAHRRFIDNHHAHAELKEFKCDNCGYVFETGNDLEKSEEEEFKKDLIGELNKKLIVEADMFSKSAKEKIEKLGGIAKVV